MILEMFKYIQMHVFNRECLPDLDGGFLEDDPLNISNILECISFDQFEGEAMRTYLL